MNYVNRKVCIAPMMDWSDRHYRVFMRLISHHVLLYTEMITTGAILHGDRNRFLQHDACEHPLAIQLGGSEPAELAQCSSIAADYGYDEINLNIGCPSDRVKSGKFGACLMAEPKLVAECVAAMINATTLPVTVKTRLGIDDRDSYEELCEFIETVATSGCKTFILHARKAWLSGLSPKQNREIPPLQYDVVYRVKKDYPQFEIIINGGIKTLEQVKEQIEKTDGAMIGREAYHNPYFLAACDQLFFSSQQPRQKRTEVAERFIEYIDQQLAEGVYLKHMTRHILGLFHGVPGAKNWRRFLSENAHRPDADSQIVWKALQARGFAE